MTGLLARSHACDSYTSNVKAASVYVQAEDGIKYRSLPAVQWFALLISSRRRHTRLVSDWSSDVCSSDLHFKPTEIMSSDFFRGLVSDDENDQSATGDAFDTLHFVAGKRLAAGRLTVIDATNVQIGRASCRERV